jgi:choline dehydrogenase-like flavoprotein
MKICRPRKSTVSCSGEPLECELYVRAEQDWHSIVRTTSVVASALEQRYGAQAHVEIASHVPWPADPNPHFDSQYESWGNHHLGTTRMAEDPDDGVVDGNCRVHGTENLYVAGSSVFPTGGCANPTFMIVALAHRLVDHLTSGARARP